MKYLMAMLVAVALFAGTALAQVVMVDSTGAAVTSSVATTSVPLACPISATMIPPQCPILAMEDTASRTVVLVLGSQEQLALSHLRQRDVDWRDSSLNYNSVFEPGNPMTSHRPNRVVTRAGNPYYPYHQITSRTSVPMMAARVVELPATMSTSDRNMLVALSDRYRTLTPSQAQALGYQPSGAATMGMGQLYVNSALIDNRFDPMMPEAFLFSSDGRVLATQYMVRSTEPVTLFGQPTRTSATMNGVQYLTVWVFEPNPSGFFSDANPNIR